ncbi:uncharacterized protein RCC_04737 [Ramularia collo-cygni]|uniref:Uncharacterized protein n=1 Tax=Ramularia collo-cygni TaxID=112498 RepID=A0A2D3UQ55_9PEZI|nr:uncharacterized protein RCC_04737 [Ramularia collo-cygni]CZT18892.1 uncharacterized protein RCC_04737 [Ramularia collo-cygni]
MDLVTCGELATWLQEELERHWHTAMPPTPLHCIWIPFVPSVEISRRSDEHKDTSSAMSAQTAHTPAVRRQTSHRLRPRWEAQRTPASGGVERRSIFRQHRRQPRYSAAFFLVFFFRLVEDLWSSFLIPHSRANQEAGVTLLVCSRQRQLARNMHYPTPLLLAAVFTSTTYIAIIKRGDCSASSRSSSMKPLPASTMVFLMAVQVSQWRD